MINHIKISIVSPVFKAEEILNVLIEKITLNIERITNDYEIILVEDGSPDNSWNEIEKICSGNKKVKGVKLSRNFGQHNAITSGLRESIGDWVIVMDCDLQDKPSEFENLFNKALEGYDIVYAQRKVRKDSFFKKISSRVFYMILGYLTDTRQDHTIGNYGIYNRKVIDALSEMGDSVRFFPILLQWVGFKSSKIIVEHGKRDKGSSSYSYKKLIKLAIDNIIAFSDKPLRISIVLGFWISFFSFIAGLYVLTTYIFGGILVSGYTSIILSIWFLSGIIIFILGIVGLYIGKLFNQVKHRPSYFIEKKLNI